MVSGVSSLMLLDDKYATEYLCGGGGMHLDRVVMFEDEPTHRPLICEWHAKKEAQRLDEAARALTQSVGSVVPSNITTLIIILEEDSMMGQSGKKMAPSIRSRSRSNSNIMTLHYLFSEKKPIKVAAGPKHTSLHCAPPSP